MKKNSLIPKKNIAKEFIRIELKGGEYLPFVAMTLNLGCAEFQICAKWKRRKLVELFIYPRQQENINYYYHWEGEAIYFKIGGYEGLDDPKAWMFQYCKEHKCQSMRIYVPNGAKYLWFEKLSGIGINFTRTN